MSFKTMEGLKGIYRDKGLGYRDHPQYTDLVGTPGTTKEDYEFLKTHNPDALENRASMLKAKKQKTSERMKRLHQDPEFAKAKSERMKRQYQDSEFAKAKSERMKRRHQDPEYIKAHKEISIERMKRRHQDPEFAKAHKERKSNKLELINLSNEGLKANLDKKGLKKLIILPDYSPGRGRLPTGSVAVYDKNEHVPSAEFLGPDIGCGMALAKFGPDIKDIEYLTYKVAKLSPGSGEELGSLGRGNHFINFYRVNSAEALGLTEGNIVALVHTGSRLRGKKVFDAKLRGEVYLEQYQDAAEFGVKNREKLLEMIQDCADVGLTTILDLPHNILEETNSNFVYRKGAVKTLPGDYSIVPSFMGGKAVIVKTNENVSEIENSMVHGTGRKISIAESKGIDFDFSNLRDKICIPNFIYDSSLRTKSPECYRTLEEILPKVDRYISVVGELEALSYIGN